MGSVPGYESLWVWTRAPKRVSLCLSGVQKHGTLFVSVRPAFVRVFLAHLSMWLVYFDSSHLVDPRVRASRRVLGCISVCLRSYCGSFARLVFDHVVYDCCVWTCVQESQLLSDF